jgi:hypothetical protein
MNENIETVKSTYAAFGRGDIPGVLELLSPDIDWTIPGPSEVIPYAGHHKGREDVGKFFASLGMSEDVRKFEAREFFAQDNTVVVLGHYHAHVKATGREYNYDWAHVFTLSKGHVTKFREYSDTAAAVEAYRT